MTLTIKPLHLALFGAVLLAIVIGAVVILAADDGDEVVAVAASRSASWSSKAASL